MDRRKDQLIESIKERLILEEEKEAASVEPIVPFMNRPFRKLMEQYLTDEDTGSEGVDQLTQVAITAITQGAFYIHTGGVAVEDANIPIVQDIKGTDFVPLYSYGEETDLPIRLLDLAPFLLEHKEVHGIWIDPMEKTDFILPADFLMEAFCEITQAQ